MKKEGKKMNQGEGFQFDPHDGRKRRDGLPRRNNGDQRLRGEEREARTWFGQEGG